MPREDRCQFGEVVWLKDRVGLVDAVECFREFFGEIEPARCTQTPDMLSKRVKKFFPAHLAEVLTQSQKGRRLALSQKCVVPRCDRCALEYGQRR